MGKKNVPVAEMSDDALLAFYAGLVKKIARKLMRKLPTNIELDDLVQEGMIALWEAQKRFDPDQGVMFETFASRRIQGTMLDYLRRENLLSGCNFRKMRKLNRTINGAEHINRGELSRALGLSFPDLEEILIFRNLQVMSGEETSEDKDEGALFDKLPSPYGDPVEVIELHELIERIELALKRHARLAKSERIYAIFQHHLEGESWSEIAHIIGVSKARMFQIVAGIRNAAMVSPR